MNKRQLTLDGELFDQWLDWLDDDRLDLLRADLLDLQRAALVPVGDGHHDESLTRDGDQGTSQTIGPFKETP